MDPMADLLVGVRARSTAFCQAILEPPWALRIADGAALALATTLRGDAWIVPDQGEPVLMHIGDVAIIKGPHPYTVADDPATAPDITVHPDNRLTTNDGVDVTDALRLGPRTSGYTRDGSSILASGTYQVSNDVTGRLLNALPDIVLVPEADVQGPVMALLTHEVGSDGPAQQVVLDRLLDIALISTLRAWFALQDTAAPGWYRAHDDALAGPALQLMHDDPAHPWTVEGLAARVGCSRAAFARRFTDAGRGTADDLPDRLADRTGCRPAPNLGPHHRDHRSPSRLRERLRPQRRLQAHSRSLTQALPRRRQVSRRARRFALTQVRESAQAATSRPSAIRATGA